MRSNKTAQVKVIKTKHAELPSGWEMKKLKELGEIISGLTYKPEMIRDNGVLVLRSSNVQNRTIVYNDNVYVDPTNLKFNSVQEGDILICVRNGSRSLIGKNARIDRQANGLAFGAFMSVFRSKHNDYLLHVFDTDIYNREIHINLGATINSINSSELKEFKIPLPPLPEQHSIANVLSTWDNSIHTTQALISQKQHEKKWLMQSLLTGKKRLKGFSGEWKTIQIENLFSKKFRYANWSDDDSYRLISIRRRNGGLFDRGVFLGHQIGVKKIKEIKVNDFLISKRQVSHGAWAVVQPKFDGGMVSDEYDCLTLVDENLLSMDFWDWFCRRSKLTNYAYLASNGVHIEKLIFDFDTFKRRRILIPNSIEEQTAIAQVLQTADKEITLLKAKLDQQKLQKKGLMQVLLTGKIRVNR